MARRRRREANATAYKLCSLLLQYPDERAARRPPGARRRRSGTAALARSRGDPALHRVVGRDTRSRARPALRADLRPQRAAAACTSPSTGSATSASAARRCCASETLYRAAGLPQDGAELPDYLPLMLEFAAHAPDRRGERLLREQRPALELIRVGAARTGQPLRARARRARAPARRPRPDRPRPRRAPRRPGPAR